MRDASLDEQLDRVMAVVREVLGTKAIGAYLYGSAVAGGLRPGSDVDVFVVSRRPTTREEKQHLVDGLVPISRKDARPPSWRPVELTIAVQSEVRPWHYPPQFDFQYGEWLRDEFDRGDLEPWPSANPDLAVLITMVLLNARPLLGPPAATLLDPVPRKDLVCAMVDEMDVLLADLASDTGNVILTLARIWSTIETGAIHSKDGAADWALARLPDEHRPVLVRARDIYLGREEERWDDLDAAVRAYADHVVGEIERLSRDASPQRGGRDA